MLESGSATGVRLSRIGQIYIPVKDLGRAVRFYRDTLGITFLFEVPRMAFLECGGIRLMLGTPEDASVAQSATILYYKVDDIRGVFTSLEAQGVEVAGKPHLIAKMPSHDLWMAFLRDSEGNMFALMSEEKSG